MYISNDKKRTKRTAIYESQAKFLAKCIRILERVFRNELNGKYNPDEGDSNVIWMMQEYDLFHDAAYACGFVCNNMVPNYNLDSVNKDPVNALKNVSLIDLRQYTHTLLRAERNGRMDGYYSAIGAALESGALGIVANRLESDGRLYDPGCSI